MLCHQGLRSSVTTTGHVRQNFLLILPAQRLITLSSVLLIGKLYFHSIRENLERKRRQANLYLVDRSNVVLEPETLMMKPFWLHSIKLKRSHHLGHAQSAMTWADSELISNERVSRISIAYLPIALLQFLHEARPDFAYSVAKGRETTSSPSSCGNAIRESLSGLKAFTKNPRCGCYQWNSRNWPKL